MTFIRRAAVAGMFYPGSAAELDAAVRQYLAGVDADAAGPVPKAIIAPHAGYVYSGPIAASAYARLKPAHAIITRAILLGPCHRVPVRGLALSGADAFATPLGAVPVDRAWAARVTDMPQVSVFDATHEMEHSLEVHLPFLQVVLDDFSVVPLVVGDASPDEVAEVLDRLWGGPETTIVVSSDLSHYLDYDSAKAIDGRTCKAIERLDPAAIERNGACGRFPVGGLLALAKRRGMTVETLDMRNSGDTAGPRDQVVGYGSWMFLEPDAKAEARPKHTVTVTWHGTARAAGEGPGADEGPDADEASRALLAEHGETLLRIAARSILHGLETGKPLALDGGEVDPALTATGAAFVTLKNGGRLRGCIGTPEANRPLCVDVAENAYRAAFKDPRFKALAADELDGLALSVSVLGPQVAMTFTDEADLLRRLRPGIDGLVIEDSGRRALFLPSVWSQLPTAEVFLQHLKAKAGLAKDHWSDSLQAWRFTAEDVHATDLADPAAIWAPGPDDD